MLSLYIFVGIMTLMIVLCLYILYKMNNYDADAEHRENFHNTILDKYRKVKK